MDSYVRIVVCVGCGRPFDRGLQGFKDENGNVTLCSLKCAGSIKEQKKMDEAEEATQLRATSL